MPADLQSAPVDRFGIDPNIQKILQFYTIKIDCQIRQAILTTIKLRAPLLTRSERQHKR